MAQRYYEEAGRIILSKPGYDASPSLPDAFKILDSNWAFSGAIIAAGRTTVGGTNPVISFPPQHYVPAAEVLLDTGTSLGMRYAEGAISNSSITIIGSFPAGAVVDYIVYGISQ